MSKSDFFGSWVVSDRVETVIWKFNNDSIFKMIYPQKNLILSSFYDLRKLDNEIYLIIQPKTISVIVEGFKVKILNQDKIKLTHLKSWHTDSVNHDLIEYKNPPKLHYIWSEKKIVRKGIILGNEFNNIN